MRDRKLTSLFVATGLLLSLPLAVGALGSSKLGDRPGKHRERASGAVPADISAYEGLGTWVDMFNARPWRSPEDAVKKMAQHGTRTIYVETSNFSQRFSIFKPEEMGRLIEAAHARDMNVVAWYLPSFKNIRKDLKRSKAAIKFESPSGERFDSFALDIESTAVSDITTRNRRAISLSDKIRRFTGDDYPLGAIIPDPAGQLYWQYFPYVSLNEYYDVFLPMGYYTYRTNGFKGVLGYTKRNIQIIRSEIGDETVPVHVIGGLAGSASRAEVRAFVAAAVTKKAMGGSLYDYPIMKEWEWTKLQPLRQLE